MTDQQQLLLWQWSTGVQLTSLVMIATFFGLFARFGRRTELRSWALAWAANLLALSVTLVFWYARQDSLVPLVGGVYIGAKTAFVLLFVQGVWLLARPGAPQARATTLMAAAAAYGAASALFVHSVPAVGVAQHLPMGAIFLALAVATARAPGLLWLAVAVAVRGGVALAESASYALQFSEGAGTEWRAGAAAFLAASSAFDMAAEWLLVLGSVLAVSARTQRDLERTNRELLAAQAYLRTVADRDPLTTLANRRTLAEVFHVVQPLGAMLLFFDLDRFKELNDRHGHLAGDRCLRDFAGALRDSFRPNDYVIRYGGDEFLVVAVGLDRASAIARVEALSARIRGSRQDTPAYDFSVGMSELPADGHPEAALRVADEEMYRAKAVK